MERYNCIKPILGISNLTSMRVVKYAQTLEIQVTSLEGKCERCESHRDLTVTSGRANSLVLSVGFAHAWLMIACSKSQLQTGSKCSGEPTAQSCIGTQEGHVARMSNNYMR